MSDDPIERLDEQREADIALRLNGGSDPMVFDEAEAASLLRIIRRQRRLIERLARERDDATRALGQLRDIVSNDPNGPALRILVLIDAALSRTEAKG